MVKDQWFACLCIYAAVHVDARVTELQTDTGYIGTTINLGCENYVALLRPPRGWGRWGIVMAA